MISYRAPAYRPGIASAPQRRSVQHHQLGAMGDMSLGNWALLLGGAIVGGVGVNAIINQAYARKPNAVNVLLGLAVAAVGLTVFVREGGKAIGPAGATA